MKDVCAEMRPPPAASGVVMLVACLATTLDATAEVENWPWWQRADEARLQRVAAGRRAELHCAGRLHAAPAHWDFKACGGENDTNCAKVIRAERSGSAGSWTSLSHNRSSFELPETSLQDSGLYRCREAATDHINVYSTVELQVLQFTTDEDPQLPEFLDDLPENVTITTKGQVIMQCKVSSTTKPTIIWLSEWGGQITYRGRSYALLNSSGEMSLPGGIYLSKMVISEVRLSHAGWYYCVAINTKGFSNHSAYLTVVPSTLAEQTGRSSFYWLFLMPVALAIIPLLLWSVYLCNRRSAAKTHDRATDEQTDLDNLQVELVHLNVPRTIQENEMI